MPVLIEVAQFEGERMEPTPTVSRRSLLLAIPALAAAAVVLSANQAEAANHKAAPAEAGSEVQRPDYRSIIGVL